MLDRIREKIASTSRISVEEAAWLSDHADDATLSELATAVRARFHPPHQATYVMMAIVNYTNVCVAKCDYCAFYRLPHQAGGYLLSFEEVCAKIDELVAFGGRLVGFNGGFHPKLRITDYADLFAKIHARYGDSLAFYEMTVAEFMFSCKLSKLSYRDGAELLKAAGTRWITGGGAEVLDDAFRRRHSPGKYTVADYFKAQRAILDAGLGSTATMVIGFDETLAERLNHLAALRAFQDEVDGALTSFLCWTYKPWNNELGGQEVSTREYLRWLAISRIFLDNIVHIRTSVLTKNEDAMAGLRFGANDFDLPTEDEVTQRAGATITHEFERVIAAARRQGFEPVQRAPFTRHIPSKSAHFTEISAQL
jgi:cyclic dehypoxanthinyl futalosine synthase